MPAHTHLCMDDIFRFTDKLGPARIIHVSEPSIRLRGILVVDNVAAGPAIGGMRMAPDVSLTECTRLARAMTLKNAAASLPHGGAKSVLWGDPRMPAADKEQIVRAFACALAGEQQYIFGPDMGTDETSMAWVKEEIGDRAVGLPREIGGIPLDEEGATGWGVRHAVEAAMPFVGFDLDGARVAVQGFGSVGKHTARFLSLLGARLVAASDSRGTIANPDGLDVGALIALKAEGGRVVDHSAGEARARDAILDVDCEIWIPAARPDIITEQNAHRLRAKLVAEGANIPVTAAAEAMLHDRGVVCLPDFITNAGGAICGAMEFQGLSKAAAFDAIRDKVRANVDLVLERAGVAGQPPRAAALELSTERVKRAMSMRRWSTF